LNSYAKAIEWDVLDPKILQILSESATKGITYVPDNQKWAGLALTLIGSWLTYPDWEMNEN
jgi:hypothetical protein